MKYVSVLALVAVLLAGCAGSANLPAVDAHSAPDEEVAHSADSSHEHAAGEHGEGRNGNDDEDSELAPEPGEMSDEAEHEEEHAGQTAVRDQHVGNESGIGEVTEPEPEYIDESQHEGEEAVLVKLINASIKAINTQDEERYWSLLSPKTPIGRMPPKYYSKVSVQSFGAAGEERIAEVLLQEPDKDYEISAMYVFTQENGEWKILDID